MSELSGLILSLATGIALGAVFFGGLWWTVKRSLRSKVPVAWVLASLIIRTVVVVAGFGLVSNGRWQRLAACLLGFTVARFVSVRLGKKLRASDRSAVPDA